MVEDSPLHNRQAEAHSARLRRAKRGKNFFLQIGSNTCPVVFNGDDDPARFPTVANGFGGELDPRFRFIARRFGRVRDEVRKSFRERSFISEHFR